MRGLVWSPDQWFSGATAILRGKQRNMPGELAQSLTAALVQFDVALGKPEENLARAVALLEKLPATGDGPLLAVLPEVFTTNFTFHGAEEFAAHSGKALERLAALAREREIAIAGSIIEAGREAGRYANRAFFIDEQGERRTRYAKRHLITIGHEHLFYEEGDDTEARVFEWHGIPMAMAICYDLRFPEWLGRLAFAGARVFVVPAQWPKERLAHWRTLLQARAIENQAFFLGCNRTGVMENTVFAGGSAIIDPWGEIVAADAEGATELVQGRIDLALSDEVRSRLPAFSERQAQESK